MQKSNLDVWGRSCHDWMNMGNEANAWQERTQLVSKSLSHDSWTSLTGPRIDEKRVGATLSRESEMLPCLQVGRATVMADCGVARFVLRTLLLLHPGPWRQIRHRISICRCTS